MQWRSDVKVRPLKRDVPSWRKFTKILPQYQQHFPWRLPLHPRRRRQRGRLPRRRPKLYWYGSVIFSLLKKSWSWSFITTKGQQFQCLIIRAEQNSWVLNCLFWCSLFVGLEISCSTIEKLPNSRIMSSSADYVRNCTSVVELLLLAADRDRTLVELSANR